MSPVHLINFIQNIESNSYILESATVTLSIFILLKLVVSECV